jgi:hypothetical protein
MIRFFWRLLLQSLLITINQSAFVNLPTSQITRTRSILVLVLRCTPLHSFNSHSVLPQQLFCTPTTISFGTRISYIHSVWTPRKTPSLNTPSTINERSTVPRYVSAGVCLAARCLQTGQDILKKQSVTGGWNLSASWLVARRTPLWAMYWPSA